MRPTIAIIIGTMLGLTPVPPAVADAPIQPGASLGGCTMNFIFRDGAKRYVGTAGHCIRVGERARTSGSAFGTAVFSRNDDTLDFALIKIDAGRIDDIDPAVRAWGGPTGIARPSDTSPGDLVSFHGYGHAFGSLGPTRARQGVLISHGSRTYTSDMPAVNGDSGAPLLHAETGKALGIISEYGFSEVPPTTDVGHTIAFIVDALADAGFRVSLVTP